MAASGKRSKQRSKEPGPRPARTVALTQPQFGTTGGEPVSSQTGSAGSESGGAQFGTSASVGDAPQTGAGATQAADAKKMPRRRRRSAQDRNTPNPSRTRRN